MSPLDDNYSQEEKEKGYVLGTTESIVQNHFCDLNRRSPSKSDGRSTQLMIRVPFGTSISSPVIGITSNNPISDRVAEGIGVGVLR